MLKYFSNILYKSLHLGLQTANITVKLRLQTAGAPHPNPVASRGAPRPPHYIPPAQEHSSLPPWGPPLSLWANSIPKPGGSFRAGQPIRLARGLTGERGQRSPSAVDLGTFDGGQWLNALSGLPL